MADQWKHQIRIYLNDELSETARRDDRAEAIKPIMHVLAKHRATMKSQFDAFADYVREAEERGMEAAILVAEAHLGPKGGSHRRFREFCE